MERLHRNIEEECTQPAGVYGRGADRACVTPAAARRHRCRRPPHRNARCPRFLQHHRQGAQIVIRSNEGS